MWSKPAFLSGVVCQKRISVYGDSISDSLRQRYGAVRDSGIFDCSVFGIVRGGERAKGAAAVGNAAKAARRSGFAGGLQLQAAGIGGGKLRIPVCSMPHSAVMNNHGQ